MCQESDKIHLIKNDSTQKSKSNRKSKKKDKTLDIPQLGGVLENLKLSFFCGLGIIVLFALQAFKVFQPSSWSQVISIAGVGFLIAVAFLFFGMFIGFIFGIPRILSQESRPLEPYSSEEKQYHNNLYGENSNFDQISDWLTKILVGVGLTQLIRVPAALQQYSEYIGPALGDFPSSGTFGIAILIFFSVDGFFIGYLWTRRCAAVEFGKGMSELYQITDQVNDIQTQLNKVDERAKNNSEAINLVKKALYSLPGEPLIDQSELNEKIREASEGVKAQIFFDAADVRYKNWSNKETKPIMERTIPIFRALVACDIENKYHKSHGHLGFALKDKLKPDWVEAFNELTKAIEIRGPWMPGDDSFGLYYEFNRAVCRIHLDEGYNNDKSSTSEAKELILKDISYANQDPHLSKIMQEDESIKKWMKLNNINDISKA